MNYTEVNLDLQSLVKKIYFSLIYKSSFYKFLNEKYLGEIRTAGTPMIEIVKAKNLTVNVRNTKEIENALTPTLAEYENVKVDLTELAMDYSVRVPVLVSGSDITNALDDAIMQKDSAVAKQIDTYGFGVLASGVTATETWAPATAEEYIGLLNGLKAKLFNKDVYDGYRLGLSATEYAKLVSALTSVLKYETMVGIEAVDRGEVAQAYGIEAIFPVNDTYLGKVKGYFFNSIAVVGDAFFDSFVSWNGNYPGFPGYFVIEGNIMFGAKVVRDEAIIKLTA